jgi:hypothetical protein
METRFCSGSVFGSQTISFSSEIISGPAEIGQSDLLGIEVVQMRQRLNLADEDFPPVFARLGRQRGIPEHSALLHRHDVEGRTDDAVVGAECIGMRDRETLLGQRRDDAELAVDGMRRRQQFAEWFPAHHIGAAGRVQPVGRIGLAAPELQDAQRSLVAVDIASHPAVEADLVDPMPFLDRLGAGKFLVFPDAVGHLGAPLDYSRERCWRSP